MNDGIAGHAYADFFPVAENFGQAGGAVQYEGEGSGQIAFHQFERAVIDLGIFADTAQIITDDGKVVLLRIDVLQPADAFDGAFLQSVAADGIHGIGGIDDDSSVIQDIDYPLQVGGIVIFFIKFQKHGRAGFDVIVVRR
ncbi:conserved domain protein [Bacteroides fluxus YIT 12057]|uniref:Conserved domain protein n=1 Tax=Bacteroides fluxus YIT 12057 TaxID=763034 RepID=F3PTB5_9BACE|nr:conserved domain protein [Bacteroides fluxus YIT 12057]